MSAATDALSVSAELATRMLIAIWNSQWTSHNAAENQVCAFGCNKGDHYSDQFAHYDDCVFVHLWNDLRALREAPTSEPTSKMKYPCFESA